MGQGSAYRRWFVQRTRRARMGGGRIDGFARPRGCAKSARPRVGRAHAGASGKERTGIAALEPRTIVASGSSSGGVRALGRRLLLHEDEFGARRSAKEKWRWRSATKFPRVQNWRNSFNMQLRRVHACSRDRPKSGRCSAVGASDMLREEARATPWPLLVQR